MKSLFKKEKQLDAEFKGNGEVSPEATMTESTIIFKGIHFVGNVEGAHDFYLNGQLEGKINIKALVTVGRTGRFKGELNAKNVIIEGEVDGNVTAEEKVEIRDSAQYTGEIITPCVLISDQAYFQGTVTMMRESSESKKSLQDIKSPEKILTPKKLIKENSNKSKQQVQKNLSDKLLQDVEK